MDDVFDFGELIHAYTRKEALEDGELVDVSSTTREAGIRYPVALTRAAWAACVAWSGGAHQDESGRLWDVCWLLACFIRKQPAGVDRFLFTVRVVPDGSRGSRTTPIALRAVCSGGDAGEPVVTVMLEEED